MHAIVVEESLRDKSALGRYSILKTKIDDNWHLHVIDVLHPEAFINDIQSQMMRGEEFYFHLYDEGYNLIIAFRNAFFNVDPLDPSTWKIAIEHGKQLNIKEEQLDFYPRNYDDEAKWLRGE